MWTIPLSFRKNCRIDSDWDGNWKTRWTSLWIPFSYHFSSKRLVLTKPLQQTKYLPLVSKHFLKFCGRIVITFKGFWNIVSCSPGMAVWSSQVIDGWGERSYATLRVLLWSVIQKSLNLLLHPHSMPHIWLRDMNHKLKNEILDAHTWNKLSPWLSWHLPSP